MKRALLIWAGFAAVGALAGWAALDILANAAK
jgi:hypothetical protein